MWYHHCCKKPATRSSFALDNSVINNLTLAVLALGYMTVLEMSLLWFVMLDLCKYWYDSYYKKNFEIITKCHRVLEYSVPWVHVCLHPLYFTLHSDLQLWLMYGYKLRAADSLSKHLITQRDTYLQSQKKITPQAGCPAFLLHTRYNISLVCRLFLLHRGNESGYFQWLLHKWREGYLLPTWAWKITCQHFDWMLQSSSGQKWKSMKQCHLQPLTTGDTCY